jgi:hypothetical protein
MAVLNPLSKGAKNLGKKVFLKKRQKNGVFYFYFCGQNFSTYNFFAWFIALFSTDLNSAENLVLYDTRISFLLENIFWLLLAHFTNAKRERKGSKKRKTYFCQKRAT